jgi:site-specific DNA recombinase
MKAAIYCRVSTTDQKTEGTSLESQLEACKKLAKERGFEVTEEFTIREVYSGLTLERPDLVRLRDWLDNREVDAVVIYDSDRFSRDGYDFLTLVRDCKRANAELLCVVEPLTDGPVGELLSFVRGWASGREADKIKERTMRGKREKCMQGNLATGGAKLFGYDLFGGKRVINTGESEFVSRIFKWFAYEGYTLYQAQAELNRMGISSPRGTKWNWNTIYHLVTNPAYKGETYAFRYKVVEPKSRKSPIRRYGKTRTLRRDKGEWILVPNGTPPIVGTEVWGMAQEQLRRNRLTSPRNRKHQYLLTNGRLRCGVCGRSMIGACQKRKTVDDWLLYRCICNIKSAYYEKCPQHSIPASKVEPLVWNEVTKVLRNPSLVIAELGRQRGKGVGIALEAEEILVRNRIEQLQKEEKRYLRLYGQGKFDDSVLFAEVERTKRDKGILEEKLVNLREQKKSIAESERRLEGASEALAVITNNLDKADHNLKQLALSALDIKATLYPDNRLHITGSIPTGGQLPIGKSLLYASAASP